MPLRTYLVILILAIAAAGVTVVAAQLLLPHAVWAGPATMAVLAALALGWHFWSARR